MTAARGIQLKRVLNLSQAHMPCSSPTTKSEPISNNQQNCVHTKALYTFHPETKQSVYVSSFVVPPQKMDVLWMFNLREYERSS